MTRFCPLRPIRIAFWCLLLAALAAQPLLAQAPPSADTFVSSSTPKTNYGSAIALVVGSGTTSYVRFNLAGIPAGSSISKATLRLYVDAVAKNGTFDVYQLNSSWVENTLTYNTPPPPLGLSVTNGTGVSITSASWNQFLLIDITALAQGWVNGTIPNNGVALALTSGSNGSFSFDSKESLLTGNGPELEIAFNSGTGPQGPAGPVGPQGPQGTVGAVGPTGATGATGSQGATGLQGAQGALGPMGLTGAQGLQGVGGPQGAAGTGFNFRAVFDNTSTYSANDVVTYNGASYVATVANQGPNNPTPDQNSAAWSLMAQAGVAGAQGAMGLAGSPGPVGPQGPLGPQGLPGLPPPNVAITNATNTFTASQNVFGDLTASGIVSGGTVNAATSFNLGGSAFGFGSSPNANTFLGFFAGSLASTGVANTGIGSGDLVATTTGSGNTATGSSALGTNVTGSSNTGTGNGALLNNTTGSFNTASGADALFYNLMGSYNTGLGYFAGPPLSKIHQALTNASAVGAFAEVDQSNAMVLGSINGVNGATADTNIGIGTTTPNYRLHIGTGNNGLRVEGPPMGVSNSLAASFGAGGEFSLDGLQPGTDLVVRAGRFLITESGYVGIMERFPANVLTIGQGQGPALADGWSTYSSRRWKKNIRLLDNPLKKVQQLRGVSYDLKDSGRHEIGVIAEEVGAVVPEIVTYEKNGKDARGVDYARLTALLIEATKEQQREIHQQRVALRAQATASKQQQRQIRQQQDLLRAQATAIGDLGSELQETRQSLLQIKTQLETAQPTLWAGK